MKIDLKQHRYLRFAIAKENEDSDLNKAGVGMRPLKDAATGRPRS